MNLHIFELDNISFLLLKMCNEFLKVFTNVLKSSSVDNFRRGCSLNIFIITIIIIIILQLGVHLVTLDFAQTQNIRKWNNTKQGTHNGIPNMYSNYESLTINPMNLSILRVYKVTQGHVVLLF